MKEEVREGDMRKTHMLLGILNGNVNQLGVIRLLRRRQNQRRVGRRILRLILVDGCCSHQKKENSKKKSISECARNSPLL